MSTPSDAPPPVYWHEGMFLRPHHFQAAERFHAGQLRQSAAWDVHHNWGLREVELNADALKNYRVEVIRLQARLRDGTLVRIPRDGVVAPLDLKPFLGQAGPVEVSLAVPVVQEGRANVGAVSDGSRYQVQTPRDGQPDENTGQNPRPVSFRRLNMKLLAAGQDPAGFEVLPLVRVERSGMAEAAPQVYKPYIPPVLACDAWEELQVGVLQQVYHRVGKLVTQRAKQVVDRRITFDSNSPGDRQIFEGLRVLNEAMAGLGVLATAEGIHPLVAYQELCRIVGRLAVFGPDLAAPELPRYDHDDLGGCFFTVKRLIDDLLGRGTFELGYEEVAFVGQGLQMRVSMKPEWLSAAYQMYVGVASGIPTDECVRMLQGQLNMKIGASNRVEEIFKRGLMGLAFAYDSRPPRVLPDARSITYFRINRDLSKDEWAHVQSTLSCAVRFNENLVDGTIQGQQDVSIRSQAGKTVRLRFTLYLIPPQA